MIDGPRDFERRVAALYRLAGAEVRHDAQLAGSQVDVLVTEHTQSGTAVLRIVECKAYASPVGVAVVRVFASFVDLVRTRGLADLATIVSTNGFTTGARQAAETYKIELLEEADLEQRVSASQETITLAAEQVAADDRSEPAPYRAFVIMPFDDAMQDTYLLGIREVAETVGMVVDRADDFIHNGSIFDLIHDQIERSDLIIAETSESNPNVMYELGYARGVRRPVLLIAKSSEQLPFDIRGLNHIVYTSIVDLRDKLRPYLQHYVNQRE